MEIAQSSPSQIRDHSHFAPRGLPEWSPFPRIAWPPRTPDAAFRWEEEITLDDHPSDKSETFEDRLERFSTFAEEDLDPFLGAWVYFQLRDVRKWVHRRVETIQIVGTESVRRRVSVDFSLPMARDAYMDRPTIAPFAVLRKDAIADFELRDEGNRALPLLNRYQNQYVALSVLYAVSVAILGEGTRVSQDVLRLLACLTYGDSRDGGAALDAMRLSSDIQTQTLVSNDVFMSLCETFKEKFLLLVPLYPRDGDRRVLRFSYLQTLQQTLLFRDRAGWRPTVMHVDLPAVDEAGSYHCEIEVPEGLEVAESPRTHRDPARSPETDDADDGGHFVFGRIWTKAKPEMPRVVHVDAPETARSPQEDKKRKQDPWWTLAGLRDRIYNIGLAVPPEVVPKGENPIPVEVKVRGKRIHFKMEAVPSGTDAFAEVWFRRSLTGFLRSAKYYALYVSFVLFVLLGRVASLQPRTATTVLLSLSGLVSLFVVRANEHSLASKLLVVARFLVWMLAATVYGAALLIVVGLEDDDLAVSWMALSVTALLITVLLGAIAKFREPLPRGVDPAFSVASAEGNLIAVGDAHHEERVAHGLRRLLASP